MGGRLQTFKIEAAQVDAESPSREIAACSVHVHCIASLTGMLSGYDVSWE